MAVDNGQELNRQLLGDVAQAAFGFSAGFTENLGQNMNCYILSMREELESYRANRHKLAAGREHRVECFSNLSVLIQQGLHRFDGLLASRPDLFHLRLHLKKSLVLVIVSETTCDEC